MTTRSAFPDLQEVIQAWLEKHGEETRVAFPARVQRYDAAAQVADLVPVVKHAVPQPDGSHAYEDLPVLPHVPVLHPRGGGFFVSFPLAAGDHVLVVCCDDAYGHWRAGATDGHPGDLRRHDLAHAVCLPVSFYPRAQALQDASPDDLVIGKDGPGGARIAIKTDNTIEIAGNSALALAGATDTQLTAIRTAINALAALLPGPPPPPFPPATPIPSVGTTKVKGS